MKICCISDQHGDLSIDIPACDLLLIAGDFSRYARNIDLASDWLKNGFNPWLNTLPAKEKVIIAGNHDIIFQKAPELVPELHAHYLFDSSIELFGLKIYGSPWQLVFMNWAFNLPEDKLSEKWQLIPDDADILLLHGPPIGIFDYVKHSGTSIGSRSLRKKIFEVKPKLVVFGHNHDGHGTTMIENITFVNASVLNDHYELVYSPIIIEI